MLIMFNNQVVFFSRKYFQKHRFILFFEFYFTHIDRQIRQLCLNDRQIGQFSLIDRQIGQFCLKLTFFGRN